MRVSIAAKRWHVHGVAPYTLATHRYIVTQKCAADQHGPLYDHSVLYSKKVTPSRLQGACHDRAYTNSR
jgi:hypothetical protein